MTGSHATPEANDDRVAMTTGEITTWVYAILVPVTTLAYLGVVMPRLLSGPASQVSWVVPMLWAIGATIAGTIVGTIIGSIVSAIATREVPASPDVRDKQIERHGDRMATAITAFGSAGALVLTMFKADHFWIGNALFVIGAIGTTWGAIARISAYRGSFDG